MINAQGGRVDWKPNSSTIAYDKRGKGGCYDVYEMQRDGSGQTCLTCDHPQLPTGTIGQPAYHPNGRFMVLQAEKQKKNGKQCGLFTNPGAGVNNDLWIINLDNGDAQLIYESAKGVLHPHFSPDGTKLLWSDLYGNANFFSPSQKVGRWALKIADVKITGNNLSISSARTLVPTQQSGEGMAEAHGFTPDGRNAIFSGNLGYKEDVFKRNDIWAIGIDGSGLQTLTEQGYNEHAHFSPSGKTMAWMSSIWSPDADGFKATEFFVSGQDGNPCQVSHFNTKGYPESQKRSTVAADLSWSPDGKSFAGFSHNFGNEYIWLVTFDSPQ